MADNQSGFFGALKKGIKWIFRPTWNNARNWFLLCILTFVGVALLGIYFPLISLIIPAKVFAGLLALPVSIGLGAIAIAKHYSDIRKGRTEFSLYTYIKETLTNWLAKSPRNIIQFGVGCVLFSLIGFMVAIHLFPLQEIFLDVIPGFQLVFNLIAIPINFFQAGFDVSMITSPLGISVFLGITMLVGYDLLCRVIKAAFPIQGEDVVSSKDAEDKKEEGEDDEVPLVRRHKPTKGATGVLTQPGEKKDKEVDLKSPLLEEGVSPNL